MKLNTNIRLTGIIILALLLTSCYKLRIEVHEVPPNTPSGSEIYIVGNFNNWNPGDGRYVMEQDDDGVWYIDMPRGVGTIEYKFTRGDWTTVEKDACGEEINNRVLSYNESGALTMDSIASWRDLDPVNCEWLTIIINSLPDNTPDDPFIALIGNLNDWEPEEEGYRFGWDDSLGKWALRIHRTQNISEVEYLVTRGSMERSEADALGNEVKPRTATFGMQDTIFIDVKSWLDLEGNKDDYITLIVDSFPANTPADDEIFFVGEINDWFPYQNKLRLEKNQEGNYFIRLPKRAYGTEYKFTRGGWRKVECDPYGVDIENRILRHEKSDTVYVQIKGWIDQ